jgi:hypothetical protein
MDEHFPPYTHGGPRAQKTAVGRAPEICQAWPQSIFSGQAGFIILQQSAPASRESSSDSAKRGLEIKPRDLTFKRIPFSASLHQEAEYIFADYFKSLEISIVS